MGFELVDGGFDGGGGEEVIKLGGGEVGDAVLADFGGEEEGGHCVPCLGMIWSAGVCFCTGGRSCTYVNVADGVLSSG